MRDLFEISNGILEKEKDHAEYKKLFAEELLKELSNTKGADIAPHLTCNFDLLNWEYVIKLELPVASCNFNSIGSNVK
ncbi:MAG: hypothetical protein HFH68_06980 [Lachnospiraceae bacterium]|nr:hypothetical protein [Lachnospiraceae bacterium]